jgi:hypothetical protein
MIAAAALQRGLTFVTRSDFEPSGIKGLNPFNSRPTRNTWESKPMLEYSCLLENATSMPRAIAQSW